MLNGLRYILILRLIYFFGEMGIMLRKSNEFFFTQLLNIHEPVTCLVVRGNQLVQFYVQSFRKMIKCFLDNKKAQEGDG